MDNFICSRCGFDKFKIFLSGMVVNAEVMNDSEIEIDWRSIQSEDNEIFSIMIRCLSCKREREIEVSKIFGEIEEEECTYTSLELLDSPL